MGKKIEINSYNYKLGQNLARLRKKNGLTHNDMETYGISRAYYGRIEIGSHSVTVEKLENIAKAFGVNVYELFLDEDEIPI